jgi:hypothetical protein
MVEVAFVAHSEEMALPHGKGPASRRKRNGSAIRWKHHERAGLPTGHRDVGDRTVPVGNQLMQLEM